MLMLYHVNLLVVTIPIQWIQIKWKQIHILQEFSKNISILSGCHLPQEVNPRLYASQTVKKAAPDGVYNYASAIFAA